MAEVPVPFTGEEVNTSNGSGALMTVIALIAGFGIFAMAQSIGGTLASMVSTQIAQFTGYDPATGENTGVPAV